jgi:hypothetical protein
MIKEYPTLVGVNGVNQGLLGHHLKLLLSFVFIEDRRRNENCGPEVLA